MPLSSHRTCLSQPHVLTWRHGSDENVRPHHQGLESYKQLKAQMAALVARQAELQRRAQAGKVTEASPPPPPPPLLPALQ